MATLLTHSRRLSMMRTLFGLEARKGMESESSKQTQVTLQLLRALRLNRRAEAAHVSRGAGLLQDRSGC